MPGVREGGQGVRPGPAAVRGHSPHLYTPAVREGHLLFLCMFTLYCGQCWVDGGEWGVVCTGLGRVGKTKSCVCRVCIYTRISVYAMQAARVQAFVGYNL